MNPSFQSAPRRLGPGPRRYNRREHFRRLGAALGVACLGKVMGQAAAAAEPPRSRLLVTNKGDRTLSIVDPETLRQIAAVPEDGETGHEVAASLDGKRAFVPIFGNSGVGKPGTDGGIIRVIDLEKQAIVGTIDFGRGVRPHCAVMCPRSRMLYVTTENENAVAVIHPDTLEILGSIPTGQAESHMLAITRDGRLGYTSNVGPGTVSVLDLRERKLLTVIPVTQGAQRISLSVDDRQAFTSDQSTSRLAVIDTAENKVGQWVPLPGTGYGTAPTPDGRWLIVALISRNAVARVDLRTLRVTDTVQVPRAPQEVLVRPDGKVAYVSCDVSKQVAVVDLKDWKVEALIDVGAGADGLAWAGTG